MQATCGGCEERGRQGTGHVHCECGNLLGVEIAGYLSVRHRGRELLCLPISIRCEACSSVWRPPEERRVRAVRALGDEALATVS